MVFRVNGIMKALKKEHVVGESTTEKFDAKDCPKLAKAALKYVQEADARVTEALVFKIYVISAPITPYDPFLDADKIERAAGSLTTQIVFELGKPSHGK
jgi:hypothetical protein